MTAAPDEARIRRIRRIRRRIEDLLRKSGPDVILKIAALLGVRMD